MTKLLIVAGARPNFMKVSPIIRKIDMTASDRITYKLVHTEQHYDFEMSRIFFDEFNIPKPDYFLNAKSGTHALQTARIMVGFEKVCLREMPDLVMVVGDVNSTLACSIVAKKLGVKVAHIEAGLRSFDMSMPEEVNRIVTDSISDYFFITERSGYDNLIKEGKDAERLFLVGNVMIDSLFYQLEQLKNMPAAAFTTNKLKGSLEEYACLTLHRPSNVDDQDALSSLVEVLGTIAERIPIIFPVHPRTKKSLSRSKIRLHRNIHTTNPLSYREFLNLWKDSKFVLTDSGGIQEETTALGVPCLTIRENTERPITVEEGTNILIGEDRVKLVEEAWKILAGNPKKGRIPELWDGKANDRIVGALLGIMA